jgi:hypothetical protein
MVYSRAEQVFILKHYFALKSNFPPGNKLLGQRNVRRRAVLMPDTLRKLLVVASGCVKCRIIILFPVLVCVITASGMPGGTFVSMNRFSTLYG